MSKTPSASTAQVPAAARLITAETVITGHTGADFDCLASMIAAAKLYPGAALVFPGSQEKNLRNSYNFV